MRMTLANGLWGNVYQQADQGAKRSALSRFSGILAFLRKSPPENFFRIGK